MATSRVVSIKLVDGSEVKGNLYIASIDGVLDTSLTFTNISDKTINAQSLAKLESRVVEQAEKYIAGLNNEVSNEVQMLYDRLSLIFPCKWGDGNSMVVLDDFLVKAPYDAVVSSKGGDGIDRVRKVLDMERRKLGMA